MTQFWRGEIETCCHHVNAQSKQINRGMEKPTSHMPMPLRTGSHEQEATMPQSAGTMPASVNLGYDAITIATQHIAHCTSTHALTAR
jgi:hypothetical protein